METEIKKIKKSLENDPLNINILISLAEKYKEIKKYEESYQFYKKASFLDENNQNILLSMALLLGEHLNRLDDSESILIKLVNDSDSFIESYENLAYLYILKNDIIKAKNIYYKALNKWSNNIDLICTIALFEWEDAKNFTRAKELYIKALSIDKYNLIANNDYTLLIEEHFNEIETTNIILKMLTEKYPSDSDVFYNYANFLIRRKKYKEAEKYYSFSVNLNPQNIDALINWALEIEKVEPQKAKELYMKALQLNLRNSDVYNHLGIFNEMHGNNKIAKEMFLKSINEDNENENAKYNLTRLEG